jgi:cytochrome c oxidase cbb3-type subunit 4
MIKNILTSIEGIDIFPVLALILFVILFLAVLIRVARMDSGLVRQLEQLPFDTADIPDENEESHNG